MKKIMPFLWFNDTAEEAAKFYASLFERSRITGVTRYTREAAKVAGRPEGSVMTVNFELSEQPFTALNGGPVFQFTEAISFLVSCRSQTEVDRLWEKLSVGGEKGRCGWLKDRYGVSWQIVPRALSEMLKDKDPDKTRRVMEALLHMDKIDISGLEQAYAGRRS